MIMVMFADNWVDEFDIEGFRIMKQEEWDEMVEKAVFPRHFCFGTNQWLKYDTKEDFLMCITTVPHVEGGYFGEGSEFGFFPYIEEWGDHDCST